MHFLDSTLHTYMHCLKLPAALQGTAWCQRSDLSELEPALNYLQESSGGSPLTDLGMHAAMQASGSSRRVRLGGRVAAHRGKVRPEPCRPLQAHAPRGVHPNLMADVSPAM